MEEYIQNQKVSEIIASNKSTSSNRIRLLIQSLRISLSALSLLGEKVAPQASYSIVAQLAKDVGGMDKVSEALQSSVGTYLKAILALSQVDISQIKDFDKAVKVYNFLISVSQSSYRHSILSSILWFYNYTRSKKGSRINTLETLSQKILLLDEEYFLQAIALQSGQEGLLETFTHYVDGVSVKKELRKILTSRKTDKELESLLLWAQFAPEVDIYLDDITKIWKSKDLSIDLKENSIKWTLVLAYLSTLTDTQLKIIWKSEEIINLGLKFSLRECIISIVDGIVFSIILEDNTTTQYLTELYFQRFRHIPRKKPEDLVGALQNSIHIDIRNSKPAKVSRITIR